MLVLLCSPAGARQRVAEGWLEGALVELEVVLDLKRMFRTLYC